jgi:hypothetical protein
MAVSLGLQVLGAGGGKPLAGALEFIGGRQKGPTAFRGAGILSGHAGAGGIHLGQGLFGFQLVFQPAQPLLQGDAVVSAKGAQGAFQGRVGGLFRVAHPSTSINSRVWNVF